MRRVLVLLMGVGLIGAVTGCYVEKGNFIAGKCDCDPYGWGPYAYSPALTGAAGPGPGPVVPVPPPAH